MIAFGPGLHHADDFSEIIPLALSLLDLAYELLRIDVDPAIPPLGDTQVGAAPHGRHHVDGRRGRDNASEGTGRDSVARHNVSSQFCLPQQGALLGSAPWVHLLEQLVLKMLHRLLG